MAKSTNQSQETNRRGLVRLALMDSSDTESTLRLAFWAAVAQLLLRLGFIAMKKTMLMSGLALFTFWAGLSLGYHEGLNNEQRAWFSTAQVERTDQGDSKIVYKFPHTRVSVNWLGRAAVNRPDPRSYKNYGHFEP